MFYIEKDSNKFVGNSKTTYVVDGNGVIFTNCIHKDIGMDTVFYIYDNKDSGEIVFSSKTILLDETTGAFEEQSKIIRPDLISYPITGYYSENKISLSGEIELGSGLTCTSQENGTIKFDVTANATDIGISKQPDGGIVIGEGDASGIHSIAGGTTSGPELIKDIVGIDVTSSLVTDDILKDKLGPGGPRLRDNLEEDATPHSDGEVGISYGTGTNAHTAMSTAIGAGTEAGSKGFFIYDITNITSSSMTLKLSNKQKPNYSYTILGATTHPNKQSWNASTNGALLNKWSVGDELNIILKKVYILNSKITSINASNGTVTISHDNIFNANDWISVTTFDSLNDITKLVLAPYNFTVAVPAKPNIGIADIHFGGLATGLGSIAAGTLSQAHGKMNLSAGQFAFTVGQENKAGYGAFAAGEKNAAPGSNSFVSGKNNEASGGMSSAQGYSTKAQGKYSHADGAYTIASAEAQTVVGGANATDDNAAFIVGNGEYNEDGVTSRSNAFVVKKDGSATLAKVGTTANSVVNVSHLNKVTSELKTEVVKEIDSKNYLTNDTRDELIEEFIADKVEVIDSTANTYVANNLLKAEVTTVSQANTTNILPFPYMYDYVQSSLTNGKGGTIIDNLKFTDLKDGGILVERIGEPTESKEIRYYFHYNTKVDFEPGTYVLSSKVYIDKQDENQGYAPWPSNDKASTWKAGTSAKAWLEFSISNSKTNSIYLDKQPVFGESDSYSHAVSFEANKGIDTITCCLYIPAEQPATVLQRGLVFYPALAKNERAIAPTYKEGIRNNTIYKYGLNLMTQCNPRVYNSTTMLGEQAIVDGTTYKGVTFTIKENGRMILNGTTTAQVYLLLEERQHYVNLVGKYFYGGFFGNIPSGADMTLYGVFVKRDGTATYNCTASKPYHFFESNKDNPIIGYSITRLRIAKGVKCDNLEVRYQLSAVKDDKVPDFAPCQKPVAAIPSVFENIDDATFVGNTDYNLSVKTWSKAPVTNTSSESNIIISETMPEDGTVEDKVWIKPVTTGYGAGDYVTESGLANNWLYQKWNSGYVEMSMANAEAGVEYNLPFELSTAIPFVTKDPEYEMGGIDKNLFHFTENINISERVGDDYGHEYEYSYQANKDTSQIHIVSCVEDAEPSIDFNNTKLVDITSLLSPGKTYTISFVMLKDYVSDNANIIELVLNYPTEEISIYAGENYTFTCEEEYYEIYIRTDSNINATFGIQIEEGIMQTKYEDYGTGTLLKYNSIKLLNSNQAHNILIKGIVS